MPVRYQPIVPNQYYHIYNRVPKKKLFWSHQNYIYCHKLLTKYATKYQIGVGAYCLMPNHYHLLLIQRGTTSLSKYISVVFNSYIQALNKQKHRKGSLFEYRFKNIPINKQEYLLHLCRYIHLNPVKANFVSHPTDWLYSDYKEWAGINQPHQEQAVLIHDFFQSTFNYENFLMEYKIEKDLEKKLEKYYLD